MLAPGGGGGGGVSHLLQLTTGLVINSSVTTSPTLAGERMLLIPKVSILSEQMKILTLDMLTKTDVDENRNYSSSNEVAMKSRIPR